MQSLGDENNKRFGSKLGTTGSILGLDLGTKTIGVACSDPSRMIASPIKTIIRKKLGNDIKILNDLYPAYHYCAIVLGLPINMNGTEGPRCQSVRSFAKKLEIALKMPIYFWDERLSTVAAERSLINAEVSRKKRAKVIDSIAACFILQGFLDRLQYEKLKNFHESVKTNPIS